METLKLAQNQIRSIEQTAPARPRRRALPKESQPGLVLRHVESLPDVYSRREKANISRLLRTLGRPGAAAQSLRELLPELTVLDLSGNQLGAKEVVRTLGEKGEWVADLDLRGNPIGAEELQKVREKLPFLEVFGGEVVSEIGFSTKCKIRELGGVSPPAPDSQPPRQGESEGRSEEEGEVLEYFGKFEAEVAATRSRVELGFKVFREQLERLDKDESRTRVRERVQRAQHSFDAFVAQEKENFGRQLSALPAKPASATPVPNKNRRSAKKSPPRRAELENGPRRNFRRKSRFRILRLDQKGFAPRGKALLKAQNEAVWRMLMQNK